MKKAIFLLIFGMLFASCKKEKSLNDYMLDSWETSYIKIEMPTFQKSDSLNIFEDKFENNPERRAQSKYNNDGTFSAWVVDRNDKKMGDDSPGKWKVVGDSLFIEFYYGGRDVKVSYFIQQTEEGFIGTSLSDWDYDGEFDDLLIMKTKRINLKK